MWLTYKYGIPVTDWRRLREHAPQRDLHTQQRAPAAAEPPLYGWIPHNAGFGFLDRPLGVLGQIHL
jgi:hypothetical protein